VVHPLPRARRRASAGGGALTPARPARAAGADVRRPAARDRWLWPLALACGLLFFASLGRLWPLADADLTRPRPLLVRAADSALAARGLTGPGRLAGYAVATQLDVDEAALDYAERTYGRDAAQQLVGAGAPLVVYDVLAKRGGNPDGFAVTLHPSGRLVGWSAGVQDDRPGARLPVDSARVLARAALAALGVHAAAPAAGGAAAAAGDAVPSGDPAAGWRTAAWVEKGAAARERPARTDHTFTYERVLDAAGDLRERAVATVAGDRVTTARRVLVEPARGRRAARAREAPVTALQTVGFALLAGGAIGALAVFLTRLRDGRVRLAPAARASAAVFACAFLTQALGAYDLLARWDPLWPRWVATLADLGARSQATAWMFVVLFALVAAGDALDRAGAPGASPVAGDGPRGATLWALGRGQVADPAVGLASSRGFAIGLVCGGVMAAAVAGLVAIGGYASVQPRGFFFYGLNASAPSLATLAFFTNIALLEELGYRFFAGRWLLDVTRRPWVAILVPAAVYGLTHTGLSFLPPAEPFWGRAVVMTLVGCVWGWAFLRYDALTVVTSHLTADLFIFNWPRLASAHPDVRLAALATVAAPLAPAAAAAAAALVRRVRRGGRAAARANALAARAPAGDDPSTPVPAP
jgi:hypothetical protein